MLKRTKFFAEKKRFVPVFWKIAKDFFKEQKNRQFFAVFRHFGKCPLQKMPSLRFFSKLKTNF